MDEALLVEGHVAQPVGHLGLIDLITFKHGQVLHGQMDLQIGVMT